jgi:hypothetical protein
VFLAQATIFAPRYLTGFTVGTGTCQVEPDGKALIQVPITPDPVYDKSVIVVEPQGTDEFAVTGVASMPGGQSLTSLSASSIADLRRQLDGRTMADLTAAPTNVLIEFQRNTQTTSSTLGTMTFGWSPGEMAYLQDVALNLIWTESSCSVN